MKSLVTFILAAMMIFCCAACSPSATSAAATATALPVETTDSRAPAIASPAAASTTTAATSAPTAASATATSEATAKPIDATPKNYAKMGDALLNSDSLGELKYGMTESDLEAAIGEPDAKSNPVTEGSDGRNHSVWTYAAKGLTLNMAQGDNKKYVIHTITATAPCDLTTQKGIKVGSSKDDVIKAYGDYVDPENNSKSQTIIAGSVYDGFMFDIENEQVAKIFIGAAAE